MPIRKSDVVESISEKAIIVGLGSLFALALAAVLYRYRGDGFTIGLIYVLFIAGAIGLIFSIYTSLQVRKVSGTSIKCPYCETVNDFTTFPEEDFRCNECNRLVPVKDGNVLAVQQVRCGYCNTLNYYSEKNDLLICESCDHEIPLSTEEGFQRHVARAYAVTDDDRLYELVLVSQGNKTEDLINALQHMLALNRNQVKNILNDLPATLLTGITRKKAEMLSAQLSIHDGHAEYHPLS